MSQTSKAAQGDESAVLENVEDLLSGEILVGMKMMIYSPHSYSEASPGWQPRRSTLRDLFWWVLAWLLQASDLQLQDGG